MPRCRETAGFLFSHPCKEQAQNRCTICQKPLCVKHTRIYDNKQLCIKCHKQALKEKGQNYAYEDDPYYLSTYYYDDYDYYDDWDQAVFSSAGDSTSDWDQWENDFDAS